MTEQQVTPTSGEPLTPKVGDKVVYNGDNDHPVWDDRRSQVGIVVGEAASEEYYTWVWDPTEHDTWQALPSAIRVVERATYTPVPDQSTSDGAR